MYLPPLSVIVLFAVFVLIAIRQIGRFRLKIWQIVLAGAIIVLLTGQVSLQVAASYVDPTVIAYLIGIFIVGEAITSSGYIQHLSYLLFRKAHSVDLFVILVLFSMGFGSMFLLNDTMAIIGTPVVLLFASREKISPKLMLLTLAFAITIGSVASPIGNPQNLLIASNGIAGKSPFVAFFSYLLLPTVINLFIAYLVLRTFYKKEFHSKPLIHANVEIKDRQLALASKISLVLLAVSILASILVIELGIPVSFNLAYIAVISALPIVLFSKRRFSIIKNIDWTTIVFFVALFVLVGSVWQCGFFQALLGKLNVNIESIPTILIASVIGSQLVSNVPMVIIYLKLIAYTHISARAAMALAAGSTIAGNLFILGAASNVIIIQNAEKRHNQTLSFFDFAKVGVVVTVLNVMVYWAFLTL